MKLTHSFVAKTFAVIMLVVFLAVFALSVVGIAWAAENELYPESEEGFFKSSWCRNLVLYTVNRHVYWGIIDDNLTHSDEYVSDYDPIGNLYFEICRGSDEKLIATSYGKSVECTYVDEYHFENSHEYEDEGAHFTVKAYLANDLTAKDKFHYAAMLYDFLYSMRYAMIIIAPLSLVVSILLFVFLMCAAGRKKGSDGIVLSWLDRIPLELLIAAYIFIALFSFVFVQDKLYYISDVIKLAASLLFSLECFLLFLSFCMSFASRTKAGTLGRNTIIFYLIFGIIKKICTNLNVLWKTIILFFLICMAEVFVFSTGNDDFAVFCFFFGHIILFFALCLTSIGFNTAKKSAKRLSRGEFTHKTDTKYMFGSIKEHIEDLNSIGDGMARAVDEKMKSERFKTELITNVSHDIKTPLTSIVNYVDLLDKENVENETAKEYIDVLRRQSLRLKKLTEDLVEASKASTGNIAVESTKVDVCELLSQSAAEYEKKFEGAALESVITMPNESTFIYADGRLMWRVFDNLLANICKYSQSGTRVYLDIFTEGGKVIITFKNISRYSLNISAEELLGRFVRGDASRTTEGSGLGLSIAKSLTELQGGRLELSVDGDLFKVNLSFHEMK